MPFPVREGARRSQRVRPGAAAVEFALVAPLLVMLVLGMIEFGRMMMVEQILTNAAREGARKAVLPGVTKTQAESAVPGLDVDAEKSHLGILADELARRRRTGTLGVGCERHQPFAHVLARRGLQGKLFVIESKVHECSCADEVVPWR